MSQCENCKYFKPFVDRNGVQHSFNHCTYIGPDAWTHCVEDEEQLKMEV